MITLRVGQGPRRWPRDSISYKDQTVAIRLLSAGFCARTPRYLSAQADLAGLLVAPFGIVANVALVMFCWILKVFQAGL